MVALYAMLVSLHHQHACWRYTKDKLQWIHEFVYDNWNKENAVYPLTIREIAESQPVDITMGQLKTTGYSVQLVKRTMIICKDGILVTLKDLQDRAVAWNHHDLQHPGSTCLEETLYNEMYWKDMRNTIQSSVKTCHSCHMNKWYVQKYRNCQLNLSLPTFGRYYVWISLDHTPSRARVVHNWLYVCYKNWSSNQLVWDCWIARIRAQLAGYSHKYKEVQGQQWT
jgi:hypothetical protein